MIALGSKSYPYLAVAQHYGIDYGEVLEFIDKLENGFKPKLSDVTDWQYSLVFVYGNEVERRKQVSGV